MKRSLLLIMAILMCIPAYSADQWAKGEPAGTRNASDIDTYIGVNNEALDRLVIGYREGCEVVASGAATINVLSGEVAIPNSAGSTVRYRRNTSTTPVTWANIDACDGLIMKAAVKWQMSRLSGVDRSILRLSAYQLGFCRDIPGKVVINEAIELAKKYSSDQAPRFVNGVLDAVLRGIETGSKQ